ncbi:NUDIX domain-containing protein [Streptomyces microflavus]
MVREGIRLVAIPSDTGKWELPGGVLKLEEPPEEGDSREVWEETDIHGEVDRLTGAYKNTSGTASSPCSSGASLPGGTERTSDEPAAVEWFTPEQITERMSEVYAFRLLDALDEAGPHVRIHDFPTSSRRLAPLGRALPGSPPGARLKRAQCWGSAGEETRCGWGGRLHGFSHLPGSGPASSKTRRATRSNSGQDHSLPELPASVRPPDHARPQNLAGHRPNPLHRPSS